jgi:NADPH-dependent 2,4-dienoyl-CoA reductase/sulfur reductase-like enzyme
MSRAKREMGDIIIVGSGIAGHRAAAELHRLAPGKSVQVYGAENGMPYDRPPLSKEFLLAADPAPPSLGPPGVYADGVSLFEGLAATAIDRDDRRVDLADGSSVHYETLLLATGSRLRHLPFGNPSGDRTFYLRTLADARRLRAALASSRSVVIVGGGFIGLEIAAAARQQGCTVTVVEMAPSLLSRTATQQLSQRILDLHEARGVTVVLGVRPEDLVEDASGVCLRWDRGEIRADIAVVGIGVVPNQELAVSAGLGTADGILVDTRCRTSDARIFAAGEVTNYPVGRLGVRARTESWSAAVAQATVAASNIAGQDMTFQELPWFWSDQYDANIQCLGMPLAAERFLTVGDPGSPSWLRIGVDGDGGLVGAEAVNRGRDMSALRRADRNKQPIPAALLAQASDDARPPAAAEVLLQTGTGPR